MCQQMSLSLDCRFGYDSTSSPSFPTVRNCHDVVTVKDRGGRIQNWLISVTLTAIRW